MKKSISLVLCLAMLISVFSCLGITASAASAKDFFTVTSSLKNDKLTYTVYLKKNVGLMGAVIYAEFDPKVLTPIIDENNGGAYMVSDGDGGMRPNIAGMYETGFMADYSNRITIGHVYGSDTDYKSGSSKAYMKFTFKVTDKNRPKTTVKFCCYEFKSKSVPQNNIDNGSNDLITSITSVTLGETKLSSVANAKTGVQISWEATTGADSYIVYRKTDGQYTNIYETANGSVTSYTDTKVSNNNSYTYTVRAKNEYGRNASYEAGLTITRITAPSSLNLKNVDGKVVASWSKVSGATGYQLYRRTVNSDGTKGSWTKIGKKTTSLTASDTSPKSGATFEYGVRTYKGSSYNILYSYKQNIYLSNPEFKVSSTVSGVKVSWAKVSGAKGYKIYRKVSGGSWKMIATADSGTTAFYDNGAYSGKTNIYAVRAVNGSYISDYDSHSVNYLRTPDISIKNTVSGVNVSWAKVSGATEYYVYRKAGSESSWTKIASTKNASYTDKNVKNGTYYQYSVRAVNSQVKSSYGGSSAEKIKFISAPNTVSVSSGKNGVTFKWNKVSGVTGYIVYRKTGSGSYSKLATVKGESNVSYLDENAQKGETYTYAVRAYYGSYISSYKTGLVIKSKY